tara:strand:- start:44 stop:760 length:717 start_codon:yes stop_codon:yes gene_type:complete
MRGIIFKTVKEGFRRLHKAHKAEVKRSKKTKTPVVPFSLKKADFKRRIRGTKFTGAAEFKAQPGLKRRILVGIERSKREKKKFRKPVIYGKAFASDKAGKTMQVQPLTFAQRKQMKKEMAESAIRNYQLLLMRNKKKGGIAGMLAGGLLTKGIKAAAKKYFKHGNKTQQIVNKFGVQRSTAKEDVKSGIRDQLKSKRTFAIIKRDNNKNPKTIAQSDKLIKYRKDVMSITRDIKKLNK